MQLACVRALPQRLTAAAYPRFRQLASEVLCSEAWAITETTLANPDEFLRPFWDAILGPPPADTASRSLAEGTAAEPEPVSETAAADAVESAQEEPLAERRMSSDDSLSTDVDLTDDSAEEKPMDLEDESPSAAASSPVRPTAPEPAKAEGWHPAAVARSGTAGDESSEDEFEEVQDDASDKPREEPGELDLIDNEREVIYGQWSRVNSHLLGKKTAEVRHPPLICVVSLLTLCDAQMLGYIRMQPAIVERLLANITSPAVVDLLIRIIQCEDNADGQGVLGVSLV